MKRHLLAAACALLAGTAFAANPTASLNRSFSEYTLGGTIGNNNVNDDNTVFWIKENSGMYSGQAVQSWFVFWDPQPLTWAEGTITFDYPILYVHDDQSELQATASFENAGVTYDYTNSYVGLEGVDKSGTSVSGSTLTIKWRASNPGDHIRVMTVVPEPSAYALAGAALLVVAGFSARRRRAG